MGFVINVNKIIFYITINVINNNVIKDNILLIMKIV